MAGPPIDGLTDIIRVIEDLQRRITVLESARNRIVSLGADYRMEVQGTGATASVHLIRTPDGTDTQIAP